MKDLKETLARHAVTALAGFGGYLVTHDLISPAALAEVDAAVVQLVEGLAVVVAAVVARLLMRMAGKPPQGTGLFLLGGLCLLMGGSLSSCNAPFPIRASVTGPGGSAGFDSKSGLVVEIDATPLITRRSSK